VGLSVVQGAEIANASRIVAVDIVENKLDLAQTLGATDVVNASEVDPVTAILDITGGRGVDYAFDALGSVKLTQQAVAVLAVGGTATIVGSMPSNQTLELNANALSVERRLQSSNMGSNRFRIDIPNYLEFYRRNKLRLDLLASHTLPLGEVNEAFRLMRSGESIRSVLVFE
jgi:S-(hydroxymethyl)glutathione dehydrogenase / alcohol dehydrogenase